MEQVAMASHTGSTLSHALIAAPRREAHAPIIRRIRAEYAEMPGLALTLAQAVRLFGLEADTCRNILGRLVTAGYLRESGGRFLRA
jgi:hypothetical protein